MSININKHNGSITVSTIFNNQYIHQTYFGYNKTECIQLFNQYIKEL